MFAGVSEDAPLLPVLILMLLFMIYLNNGLRWEYRRQRLRFLGVCTEWNAVEVSEEIQRK